jgi:hypothetical protein
MHGVLVVIASSVRSAAGHPVIHTLARSLKLPLATPAEPRFPMFTKCSKTHLKFITTEATVYLRG